MIVASAVHQQRGPGRDVSTYVQGTVTPALSSSHAVEIAAAGLRDWPDHGEIHDQLACFHAGAGRADPALHHLRLAVANEPRAAGWAAGDTDLDPIRGHPDWPA